MMRKETVFSLILTLILSSCGSGGNGINKENEQLNQIDYVIRQMQSKIDSATVLCDYALRDYKKGENPQAIILKYGALVNQFEKASVEKFQDATLKYKEGKLNQESYEKIRASVFTDSIQVKMNRLKSFGIDFKKVQ